MKFKNFGIENFFMIFATLVIIGGIAFLYKVQKGIVSHPRYMEVSAETEKEVLADRAVWNLVFDRTGQDQAELNRILLEQKNIVQNFFVEKGISKEDMEFSFFIREEYRSSKLPLLDKPTYRAGYNLGIKSKNVDLILKVKDNLSTLYEQGIIVTSNRLSFRCSLNEKIKQELSLEAYKKAYAKAQEVAKSLNVNLKKISKIYEPNYGVEDFHMNHFYSGMVMAKAMNGTDGEEAESQKAPKRKITAHVRLDIEIK